MVSNYMKLDALKVVDLRNELEEREFCRLKSTLLESGKVPKAILFGVPTDFSATFKRWKTTWEYHKIMENCGTLEEKVVENSKIMEKNSRMLQQQITKNSGTQSIQKFWNNGKLCNSGMFQ